MDESGWRASWAGEADSSSRSRITSQNAEAEPGARAHVLIVEDNELVTGALRILFEETGRRVTVAHSVAQAVTAGRADPPDLVLVDLSLPDGDGLDVVRALQAGGIRPRAVVAMTGHDDAESMRRCADAGCAELVVKPISSRELLRKTELWLSPPPTTS